MQHYDITSSFTEEKGAQKDIGVTANELMTPTSVQKTNIQK